MCLRCIETEETQSHFQVFVPAVELVVPAVEAVAASRSAASPVSAVGNGVALALSKSLLLVASSLKGEGFPDEYPLLKRTCRPQASGHGGVCGET